MGVMCDLTNCFHASRVRVKAHVESRHQLCIVIRSCYPLLKGQNFYPSIPLLGWRFGLPSLLLGQENISCKYQIPQITQMEKNITVILMKALPSNKRIRHRFILHTFSLSFSSKTTVPVAIIKSLTAREEVELLYTLQLTVADPNWPFSRSIFTDTLEDSWIITGLMEVNPNKPLALSLLSTKKTRLTTTC